MRLPLVFVLFGFRPEPFDIRFGSAAEETVAAGTLSVGQQVPFAQQFCRVPRDGRGGVDDIHIPVADDFADGIREQGKVRAGEYQFVGSCLQHRFDIFSQQVFRFRRRFPVVFDLFDQAVPGCGDDPYAGGVFFCRSPEHVAAQGISGAQNADRSAAGRKRGGFDGGFQSDERLVRPAFPERGDGGGGGGVAGDDDNFRLLGDQVFDSCADKGGDFVFCPAAVRAVGGIGPVNGIFVRHRPDDFGPDADAAHAGVDDADRGVFAGCHVCLCLPVSKDTKKGGASENFRTRPAVSACFAGLLDAEGLFDQRQHIDHLRFVVVGDAARRQVEYGGQPLFFRHFGNGGLRFFHDRFEQGHLFGLDLLLGGLLELFEAGLEIEKVFFFLFTDGFRQRAQVALQVLGLGGHFGLHGFELALQLFPQIRYLGLYGIGFGHGGEQFLRVEVAEFLRVRRAGPDQQESCCGQRQGQFLCGFHNVGSCFVKFSG